MRSRVPTVLEPVRRCGGIPAGLSARAFPSVSAWRGLARGGDGTQPTCAKGHMFGGDIADYSWRCPDRHVVSGGPAMPGLLEPRRRARRPSHSLWRYYVASCWHRTRRWFVLENGRPVPKADDVRSCLSERHGRGLKKCRHHIGGGDRRRLRAPQRRQWAGTDRRAARENRSIWPRLPPEESGAGGRKRWHRSCLQRPRTAWPETSGSRQPIEVFGNRAGLFKSLYIHIGRNPHRISSSLRRHPPGGGRSTFPTSSMPGCGQPADRTTDFNVPMKWTGPSLTIRTEGFNREGSVPPPQGDPANHQAWSTGRSRTRKQLCPNLPEYFLLVSGTKFRFPNRSADEGAVPARLAE